MNKLVPSLMSRLLGRGWRGVGGVGNLEGNCKFIVENFSF